MALSTRLARVACAASLVSLLALACDSPRPTELPGTDTDPAQPGMGAGAELPPEGTPDVPATPFPTSAPTPTHRPGTQGKVEGRVLDSEGNPVRDATVIVVEGTSVVAAHAVFTAANGQYTWILPAGTYTLEAGRDSYASARAEVTVGEGETVNLNFELAPE